MLERYILWSCNMTKSKRLTSWQFCAWLICVALQSVIDLNWTLIFFPPCGFPSLYYTFEALIPLKVHNYMKFSIHFYILYFRIEEIEKQSFIWSSIILLLLFGCIKKIYDHWLYNIPLSILRKKTFFLSFDANRFNHDQFTSWLRLG